MRRTARLACIALLIVFVLPRNALGAGSVVGDGHVHDVDGTSGLEVSVVYFDDGEVINASQASRQSVINRQWVPGYDPDDGIANLCNSGDGEFSGWWYQVTSYDRGGDIIGEPRPVCVPFPDPGDRSIPPPPELPEPPTIGEVWNAANIPAPTVHTSPTTEGVTGLETWLWASSPTTVTVATPPLNGYTVTGTARLTGYAFDFDDGPPTATEAGGSHDQPAARHTYETKGTYQLRVATTWHADFTMTGPGITTPIAIDPASAHVTTVHAYQVVEIRSRLTR